jgi:hypothetical protein
MPKRSLSWLFVLGLALTAAAIPPGALAGDGAMRLARREQGGAPGGLSQAVRQVQQETGGRVLSAEQLEQGGRVVYRIKVLTPSGQVRVITKDAGTGTRR